MSAHVISRYTRNTLIAKSLKGGVAVMMERWLPASPPAPTVFCQISDPLDIRGLKIKSYLGTRFRLFVEYLSELPSEYIRRNVVIQR